MHWASGRSDGRLLLLLLLVPSTQSLRRVRVLCFAGSRCTISPRSCRFRRRPLLCLSAFPLGALLRLPTLPLCLFLGFQCRDVPLCYPWSDAGQEQEPGPLEATDLINEPIRVLLLSLSHQSRSSLRGIRPALLPSSWSSFSVIVAAASSCCLACRWRVVASCLAVRIPTRGERDESVKMLANGVEDVVGHTV